MGSIQGILLMLQNIFYIMQNVCNVEEIEMLSKVIGPPVLHLQEDIGAWQQ